MGQPPAMHAVAAVRHDGARVSVGAGSRAGLMQLEPVAHALHDLQGARGSSRSSSWISSWQQVQHEHAAAAVTVAARCSGSKPTPEPVPMHDQDRRRHGRAAAAAAAVPANGAACIDAAQGMQPPPMSSGFVPEISDELQPLRLAAADRQSSRMGRPRRASSRSSRPRCRCRRAAGMRHRLPTDVAGQTSSGWIVLGQALVCVVVGGRWRCQS